MPKNHPAPASTPPPPISPSDLTDEILRRVEKMVATLGTHGPRCERCGNVHATIFRAVRYHMARWWLEEDEYEKDREMKLIEALRMALPPGIDVEVFRSQAKDILKEADE